METLLDTLLEISDTGCGVVIADSKEDLAQQQDLTKQEEEEEEEENQESSDKYIYHFDTPLLKESGYIQVFGKKIVVLFPEQTETNPYSTPLKQLYVNKQLVFHTGWLPIRTPTDFLKCQDIFNRFYSEYTALIQWNFWPPLHGLPKLFNESSTLYTNSLYSLACIANSTTTSIELDVKAEMHENEGNDSSKPVHVQLFIGPHLVFSSEKYLQKLDTESVHFILSYILYKLTMF
jgi:hypothetical protein